MGHSLGFLGTILGIAAGAILAPATGGASLLLSASLGGALGGAVGGLAESAFTPPPKAPQQQQPSLLALPAPAAVAAALAPVAAPPTASSSSVQTAADQPVRDNAAAFGRASTILTSGSGASDMLTTAKKSLLGS